MSWKRPVVFLAVAAAMVALILLERFVINPKGPGPSEEAGRIFPEIKEAGGLARLRVTIQGGKKVEFEHDGTSWRMSMPLSLRADESAVNRIADALDRMKYEDENEIVRPEEGKALAWRDYGLDPPAFDVEAETREGVRLRLHVGAKIQLGYGKIYVRKPDEEVAYLVKDDLRGALEREFNEFRDKHVLDFATGKVERIEAKEKEAEVVLVRRPDPDGEGAFLDGWDLEKPVRDHADKGHASRVLDRLSWLEIAPTGGFVANEYDEAEDAAHYGFDKPSRTYTLFLSRTGEKPEEQKLLVGKTVEGRPHQRYVLRAGMPFVLAVPEQKLDEIVPDLEQLRETHLLSFSTSQVKKVTVERAGVEKSLVLELVEEEPGDDGAPEKVWKIRSPVLLDADKGEVEGLLGELARTKIESYRADNVEPAKMAEWGLGEKPEFKLTLEREKEATLVLHLGKTFEEKQKHLLYAARPEFPNAYGISGKLADLLGSGPLELRARQVWAFDRTGYNRIVIERWRHRHQKEPPIRYEIKKDEDDRWHLQAPVKEEANRGVCDEILTRLSDLKVRRFLTETADAEALKEKYALDPPALRIEVAKVGVEATERRVLRLSEQDERSRIARGVVEGEKGPTGLVWELEDWHARPLFGEPIRKQVLDFAKDDMRRVEVELRYGRETYTLERLGQEWKVTQPKEQYLDPDEVDKLLGALYYLVAERVAVAKPTPRDLREVGLDRPVSRFKVALADGAAHELEVSGRSADNQNNRFARTPDRESVFVIARDKVEAIEQTLKDLGASDTPVVKEEEVPAWAPPRVEVRTPRGAFLIELFENDAPNTVANFITLVEKKFYDGLAFHRVEDWVVQGGDAGPGKPDYCIPFERRDRMREHDYGAVGMALQPDKPNSGDSQFYVVKDRKGAHHLDTKHVVFGRVLKGMEVVERIEQGGKILSARVVHKPGGRTYEVREKIPKEEP